MALGENNRMDDDTKSSGENRNPAVAEPRFLVLETSGRVAQVAVAEGCHLRGVRRLDETRRHARDLAPAVQELLASASWRARDLNGVIVSRGPGSYTGLRVGIMSAKALAYATGCAVLAIDTFLAIAQQVPPDVLRLDVLADAQQDKVYVQGFGRTTSTESMAPLSPLRVQPFAEWQERREANAWVTGPGLRGKEDPLHGDARVLDPARWDPSPQSLLQLGLTRFAKGERDDFWSLEPLYLRPSSAEEQWGKPG
jgi:tRNA threonylcarbamoyladenosine biosynthesis protein TsaB